MTLALFGLMVALLAAFLYVLVDGFMHAVELHKTDMRVRQADLNRRTRELAGRAAKNKRFQGHGV